MEANIAKPIEKSLFVRIHQIVKFVSILCMIVGFLATTGVARLIWGRNRRLWLQKVHKIMSVYAKVALKLLGFRIKIIGENLKPGDNALVVSNHLSYLDTLVISTQLENSFVTSVEIKETPVLGHICILAGCMFVERRNRSNLRNEISEITEALKSGMNVTIFPEATSTNADEVIRFRRPLYTASADAGVPVKPICLNYRKVSGVPFNTINRDEVCWYDKMEFLPHLWAVCGHTSVDVDLNFLPELMAEDAASLAEHSHDMIAEVHLPPVKVSEVTQKNLTLAKA